MNKLGIIMRHLILICSIAPPINYRENLSIKLCDYAQLTVTLFETTINTIIFDTWIQQDLIPQLPPNSVLILDNATFHKGENMKKFLEAAGHTLLYLPPYSPDLNPIEKKWPQAKALRRQNKCDVKTLFQYNKL